MKNFRVVTNNILRGGAPSEEDLEVLKYLWRVKRVVSLDRISGEKIDPYCKKLHLEHIIVPIEHDRSYATLEEMQDTINFLSNHIEKLLTQNQPVFIHCFHGQDRTGLAIALYRIKYQGWSLQKALLEALQLSFGEGLSLADWEVFMQALFAAQNKSEDFNTLTDAPTQVRDSFDSGSATQGSGSGGGFSYFSPIPPVQDWIVGYPRSSIYPSYVDDGRFSKKKKKKIKKNLDDSNQAMPYVGVRETVSPILKDVSPIGRNTSSEGISPMGILPYGNYYL